MKANLKAIFCSYADVFFLPGVLNGLLIFTILLVHPIVAISGVIAVVAAYGFARLVKMDKQFLESGYYTYNPLLVGLSIGCLFQFTTLTVFFIAIAGVMTFVVTVFLSNVFLTYLRLPILSLPFVMVSSVVYLASVRYTDMFSQSAVSYSFLTTDFGLPFWVSGFFRAFGAVLFAPSVAVGMVVSLIVLRHSRIKFLLALLGYYVGASIRSLMIGSAALAFTDLNNFNFIFIAMALGGVFLIPSPTSYLLAIIAVAVSTLFMDAATGFWYYYGIPVFTLPFNVVTLGMLYVLSLVRHPSVATTMGRSPEETLENHLANRLRYPGQDRTLFLPFSGQWTVWQGFDGQWTHKGNWRYAYDFVITDEQGKMHSGEGTRLEDYYCYNKPVLSPVRGIVAQVIDDLPDSPIGSPDETNNWGNAVIIEDARGFCVELSHFAERSIRVKKGDWVERGMALGLCGNSGYSPQPHIHVQTQATGTIGAASLSFSFVSYSDGGEFQSNNLPKEQRRVEPLYRDKRLDTITNFVLDDELHYHVQRNNKKLGDIVLKVKMALDGSFYFESSRSQLYFGKHEGTFYFYRVTGNDPWLRLLFLALPRMPLAYREKLTWTDYVPAGLVSAGLRAAVAGLLSPLYPKWATVNVSQTFVSESRIESIIEGDWTHKRQTASVELDRSKGFLSVAVAGFEFQRIDPDAPANK